MEVLDGKRTRGCKTVDWINLALHTDTSQPAVNTVIIFGFRKYGEDQDWVKNQQLIARNCAHSEFLLSC